MVIDEAENNDQKGLIPKLNSRKKPLFDLNFEPPPEGDEQRCPWYIIKVFPENPKSFHFADETQIQRGQV